MSEQQYGPMSSWLASLGLTDIVTGGWTIDDADRLYNQAEIVDKQLAAALEGERWVRDAMKAMIPDVECGCCDAAKRIYAILAKTSADVGESRSST